MPLLMPLPSRIPSQLASQKRATINPAACFTKYLDYNRWISLLFKSGLAVNFGCKTRASILNISENTKAPTMSAHK